MLLTPTGQGDELKKIPPTHASSTQDRVELNPYISRACRQALRSGSIVTNEVLAVLYSVSFDLSSVSKRIKVLGVVLLECCCVKLPILLTCVFLV